MAYSLVRDEDLLRCCVAVVDVVYEGGEILGVSSYSNVKSTSSLHELGYKVEEDGLDVRPIHSSVSQLVLLNRTEPSTDEFLPTVFFLRQRLS